MNIYEEMGIPLNDLTGLSEYNTVPTLSILARTLYSEASTESDTGKVAICYVAQNRVKTGREFGSDMTSVLLNVNNRFDGLFTENARRPTVSLPFRLTLLVDAYGTTQKRYLLKNLIVMEDMYTIDLKNVMLELLSKNR